MASDRQERMWNVGLAVCATVFFLGSLILWGTGSAYMYISPDETASAWFIELFASTGSLRFVDSLNVELENVVHPRSMVVFDGVTRPMGFLGLPVLYGVMRALFGFWIIPFLTPLIAIIAVFAWRAVLSRWFHAQVANLATVLLFTLPPFWYYTARALMPNVLFVSLLMMSVYLWMCRPFSVRVATFGSGLCLGFALFVRASEAPWIIILLIGLIVAYARQVKWSEIGVFVCGALLGFIPFFIMNTLTYGHPLMTGYTIPVREQAVVQASPFTGQQVFLPFGLDVREIAKQVFAYGLSLLWWLSIPAACGFFLMLRNGSRTAHMYLGVFVWLCVWLGVYYGSWSLHDNPDPTQVSMANSYMRYWLPVFVLIVPMIAFALIWIADHTKRFVLPLLMTLLICANVFLTFYAGDDGLVHVRQTLVQSAEIREQVISLIEPESLIIVDRADKFFFPHRVMYPLREERTYTLMPEMVAQVPLYYYGITFPNQDMEYLNDRKLKALGLRIQWIQSFGIESLYRISSS